MLVVSNIGSFSMGNVLMVKVWILGGFVLLAVCHYILGLECLLNFHRLILDAIFVLVCFGCSTIRLDLKRTMKQRCQLQAIFSFPFHSLHNYPVWKEPKWDAFLHFY